MINIQWIKFERNSIVTFFPEELPEIWQFKIKLYFFRKSFQSAHQVSLGAKAFFIFVTKLRIVSGKATIKVAMNGK